MRIFYIFCSIFLLNLVLILYSLAYFYQYHSSSISVQDLCLETDLDGLLIRLPAFGLGDNPLDLGLLGSILLGFLGLPLDSGLFPELRLCS